MCGKGPAAYFSKGAEDRWGHCGNKGHFKDKCWELIGYPSWHPGVRSFHSKRELAKRISRPKGRGEHLLLNGKLLHKLKVQMLALVKVSLLLSNKLSSC